MNKKIRGMKGIKKCCFSIVIATLFFGIIESVQAQTLDDYLAVAAENNPRVKAAYAEFEAALLEVPQVSSLPDPTLTVSAFGRMVETRLGPQEARFSLMQMFPWSGTLDAKADVAALMAEAEFQAFLQVRNEVFFEVSEQFYDLYELDQRLEFQVENLEILQNYKDLALSKVRAGGGALSDVLQVDLMRNEILTTIEILKLKKQPLLAAFNALLDREKFSEVILPENLDAENVIFEPLEVDVLQNPQLQEMEIMAASAQARKEVAIKEGMPSIGVGLDYVIVGERTDMQVQESGRDAIMPMLAISLPIYRKKYRAARKQAEFLEDSYNQRREGMLNQLQAELEQAFFEVQEAKATLLLYQKQVESSQQVLNLLLSGYRNAASKFEEILRVRQELLKYQLAVAEAEASLFTAVARIKYLSGKSSNYER